MKHMVRGHVIIFTCLLIIFLSFTGKKITVSIDHPHNFEIICDPILSQKTQEEISSCVNHIAQKGATKAHVFSDLLKDCFPCIKIVHTRLIPPTTLRINCTAHKPCYLINEDRVLLDSGTLCHLSTYTSDSLKNLPTIALPQDAEKHVSVYIKTAIDSMPSLLFDLYTISITAKGNIMCVHKEQPLYSLVFRAETVPHNIVQYAEHMKKLLESRGAFKGKSAAAYVADARFDKQIILCKNKELNSGACIY